MASFLTPRLSFCKGTFSIFIAPTHLLAQGLTEYISRERGFILSLTSVFPVITPRIRKNRSQWKSEVVSDGPGLFTRLQEATEPLIILEHDRALYHTDADLIRPVGMLCRKKVSERATVFMIATRYDEWLSSFEPYAHKMIYVEEILTPGAESRSSVSARSGQCTLEGIG